jgi:tetratricopeptide (TPR) repeat protein
MRRSLKALDDARLIALDVLPPDDAVALFREVAGAGGAESETPQLREIAELCGRLPLALRIAAALLRSRRSWTLEHFVSKFRDGWCDLTGFADTDRSLVTVFELSYQGITEKQQRLFRRLGLIPGPDTDAYGAAALLDGTLVDAERLLGDLVDHNLLAEPSLGRYRMHDLIRLYARSQSERDNVDQRAAAVGRLLDYYQHTAGQADAHIALHSRPALNTTTPRCAPALLSTDQALEWLRNERANVLAAIEYAMATAQDERIVALIAGLSTQLSLDGPWAQSIALNTAAVAAAERMCHKLAQADALTESGVARRLASDYAGATHDLQRAAGLYSEIGERLGLANVLTQLGVVRTITCYLAEAARDLQEAWELYGAINDQPGLANTLTYLGGVHRLSGNYAEAIRDLQRAVELYADLGERRGTDYALFLLGMVRRTTGDYEGARRDLLQSLSVYRSFGDLLGQAYVEIALSALDQLTNDLPSAMRHVDEALELLGRIGAPTILAIGLSERGVVRLLSGDLSGALLDQQHYLEVSRQIGARGEEVRSLNRYATAHVATDDLERARSLFDEALSLARETGMRDEQGVALEGIADCALRIGDRHGGVAYLNHALKIFQLIGMKADAERIVRRLANLNTS